MTNSDYEKYWVPARANFGYRLDIDRLNIEPSRQVAKACGIAYPEMGFWQHIELTMLIRFRLTNAEAY